MNNLAIAPRLVQVLEKKTSASEDRVLGGVSEVAGDNMTGQNLGMTTPSGTEPTPDRSPLEDGPGLTVAAVASRLGVAPATLRTWDRRYGLGPSGHAAGSHRRYSLRDLARLVVMRRLALDGVAPQDAARAALASDFTGLTRLGLERELRAVRDGVRQQEQTTLASAESHDAESGDSASTPSTAADLRTSDRLTVAPVLHLPTASPGLVGPSPSAVVDAVLAGKESECADLLAIDEDDDPARWWTDLVCPAVQRLATRTVLARPGEAPEVLLTQAAMGALDRYVRRLDHRVAAQGRPSMHPSQARNMVLVFVAPGDPNPLAAHALAASLLKHGAMVRIVTGPANEHRVLEVVAMVRPRATVMVTDLRHPELALVHAMHEADPELPIFVGLKSDAAAAELPLAGTVTRVRSFSALLYEVIAVLGIDVLGPG